MPKYWRNVIMFNALIEVLKANPRKIVFTEGHDARILEATARLVEGGFLTPILIGNVEEVKANAAKGGFNIEGVEIIDPIMIFTGSDNIPFFTFKTTAASIFQPDLK